MIPKKTNWYADISGLLKAQELWQSGTYNDISSVEIYLSRDFLIAFIRDFSFNYQDIEHLFGITDSNGKLLLQESFINYMQRFKNYLVVDDDDMNDTDYVLVCGPVIQLELLKLVLPGE